MGAALLGAAGIVGRHLGGYATGEAALEHLRTLSPKEGTVLRAILERMLAPDESAPGEAAAPAPSTLDLLGVADDYLGGLPEDLRRDFLALLHLVEHSPFAFEGRAARFTRLPAAEQDAVLDGWARSRIAVRRQGYGALKGLAMLAYYGDPRAQVLTGYPGPLLPVIPG